MSTLSFIDEFPILRHPLNLGGYHPDLKDNTVEIWLNLSDDFQERWRTYNADVATLIREAKAKAAKKKVPPIDLTDDLEQRRASLFSELWDLDEVDVAALFEESKAAGLRAWMRRRTWEIIEEYATGRGEAVGD